MERMNEISNDLSMDVSGSSALHKFMDELNGLKEVQSQPGIKELAQPQLEPTEKMMSRDEATKVIDDAIRDGIINNDKLYAAARVIAKECLTDSEFREQMKQKFEKANIAVTVDDENVSFSKSFPWGFWGTSKITLDVPLDGKAPSGSVVQQYTGETAGPGRPIKASYAARAIFAPVFLPLPWEEE